MAITTRALSDPQAIPAPDIIWNGVRGDFALAVAPGHGPRGGLRGGEAFATAVCLLLFTDAQIDDSELTVFMGGDRRGWAGDGFDIDATAGETALGSKLWTYRRAVLVAETGHAVEDEARRVLQTLIDQKACARIDAAATVDAPNGRLTLALDFYGEDGARVFALKFDDLWQAMSAPGQLLAP
jgi:phage gp46-like protein